MLLAIVQWTRSSWSVPCQYPWLSSHALENLGQTLMGIYMILATCDHSPRPATASLLLCEDYFPVLIERHLFIISSLLSDEGHKALLVAQATLCLGLKTTPLWKLKASRRIHPKDREQEKQIHQLTSSRSWIVTLGIMVSKAATPLPIVGQPHQ